MVDKIKQDIASFMNSIERKKYEVIKDVVYGKKSKARAEIELSLTKSPFRFIMYSDDPCSWKGVHYV